MEFGWCSSQLFGNLRVDLDSAANNCILELLHRSCEVPCLEETTKNVREDISKHSLGGFGQAEHIEVGGETCQLYIKHIESGTERTLYNGDKPLEGDGSLVWDKEGKALFFCTLDATHRPYRLYRRQIFDDKGNYIDDNKQHDELIFEEEDGSFSLRISKTFDLRYLLLTCSAKESTEIHYLDLDDSRKDINKSIFEQFVCISKRVDKLCYRVSCAGEYWLVQTNNMGYTPNLSLKACRIGEEKDAVAKLNFPPDSFSTK